MADLIVSGIIFIIISAAITYIIRTKKSGAKCIGCPTAGTCQVQADTGTAHTVKILDYDYDNNAYFSLRDMAHGPERHG